jgi:hydrogenase 3 maturation protease
MRKPSSPRKEPAIIVKLPSQDLPASLRALLRGRVCIVGVGNRQRGDDGAGPRLIDARHRGTRGVWLDAGIAPENFLEPIVRTNPDTVLIVDAAAFGGLPGECRLLDASALDTVVLSTHAGSLGLLREYLSARSGARLGVLAIQPERLAVGEGLSAAVETSVRELAALLSEVLASARVG